MASSLQYLQNVMGSALPLRKDRLTYEQTNTVFICFQFDIKKSFMKWRGQTFFVRVNLFRQAVCITTKIGFKLHFVLFLDESLRHESLPVIVYYDEKQQGQQQNERKKKTPFYLPHWLLYPTWMLCILVILGCGFMVVWYGMAFGNKKSLDWLASVTICLVRFFLLLYDTTPF